MQDGKKTQTEKPRKSRVHAAVLSLILPGLGQIVRGRVFAGIFFFFERSSLSGIVVRPSSCGI